MGSIPVAGYQDKIHDSLRFDPAAIPLAIVVRDDHDVEHDWRSG